jgi:hypothetical protein
MDDEMIEIKEVDKEEETKMERQTWKRKRTSDSELKKTRIGIPGLY